MDLGGAWDQLVGSEHQVTVPTATNAVKAIFVEAGFAIDVVGLAWLAGTLLLVVFAGRQRFGISWAWMAAVGQAVVAGLGGAWVAWAVHLPYRGIVSEPTVWQRVSGLSLWVSLAFAGIVWLAFMAWLLLDRRRLLSRSITHRDGIRTNVSVR